MTNNQGSVGVPPLVAVVTPVYNGAAYLAETLEAVQSQDYPNVVHVILDNASTDATPEIIARYANGRVPFRVSRNSSLLPQAENWNAAVGLIPPEAKYFRVLSADDTIAPEYVRRKVDVAERFPNVGVVGCLFHENDGPTVKWGWPSDREVFSGREAMERYFRTISRCWLPSAHTLFRCEVLQAHKPFFPKITANDLAAAMNVLTRRDLGFVHADLAMTRLHSANITSTALGIEERHAYEWLYFLDRYAPPVLGERTAAEFQKLYRRHYLRQILKARVSADQRAKFQLHIQGLDRLGLKPGATEFADALGDWALVRMGLRKVWPDHPIYLHD